MRKITGLLLWLLLFVSSSSMRAQHDLKDSISTRFSQVTLYWNPNVPIFDEGKAFFDFEISNSKASHTLLIQGVTSDGEIILVKNSRAWDK